MKLTLKDVYEDFAPVLLKLKSQYSVRTVHLFNKATGRGGATVVYRPMLHDAAGFPKGKFAEIAVAWCAPGDQYDRKLGELVALSKLQGGESIRAPIYAGGNPVLVLRSMFEEMALVQGGLQW